MPIDNILYSTSELSDDIVDKAPLITMPGLMSAGITTGMFPLINEMALYQIGRIESSNTKNEARLNDALNFQEKLVEAIGIKGYIQHIKYHYLHQYGESSELNDLNDNYDAYTDLMRKENVLYSKDGIELINKKKKKFRFKTFERETTYSGKITFHQPTHSVESTIIEYGLFKKDYYTLIIDLMNNRSRHGFESDLSYHLVLAVGKRYPLMLIGLLPREQYINQAIDLFVFVDFITSMIERVNYTIVGLIDILRNNQTFAESLAITESDMRLSGDVVSWHFNIYVANAIARAGNIIKLYKGIQDYGKFRLTPVEESLLYLYSLEISCGLYYLYINKNDEPIRIREDPTAVSFTFPAFIQSLGTTEKGSSILSILLTARHSTVGEETLVGSEIIPKESMDIVTNRVRLLPYVNNHDLILKYAIVMGKLASEPENVNLPMCTENLLPSPIRGENGEEIYKAPLIIKEVEDELVVGELEEYEEYDNQSLFDSFVNILRTNNEDLEDTMLQDSDINIVCRPVEIIKNRVKFKKKPALRLKR